MRTRPSLFTDQGKRTWRQSTCIRSSQSGNRCQWVQELTARKKGVWGFRGSHHTALFYHCFQLFVIILTNVGWISLPKLAAMSKLGLCKLWKQSAQTDSQLSNDAVQILLRTQRFNIRYSTNTRAYFLSPPPYCPSYIWRPLPCLSSVYLTPLFNN